MTLPGPQITSQDSPPSRSSATDIGRWFVAGLAEKGPLAPREVRSLAGFVATFGGRDTGGYLYDSLETFFREGGAVAIVSRTVGPDPVVASTPLFDQADSVDPDDVSLIISASTPGEWGDKLNAEVTVDGATFVITVTHDDDGLVATSPALADRDAALAWADGVMAIIVELGASDEDPRAQGPTSLAGGTDDRDNITTAEWVEALDRFAADLGVGQVSAPGITTDAVQDAVRAHAKARNRVAIPDLVDTATVGTLTAAAAALRANDDARYSAAPFAPWAVIPGILPGAFRTVPYSAVQAGLEARNAAAGRTAAAPAAGELGACRYVIGLSQEPWTDAQRETLNEAGVNVVRDHRSAVRTYGYRTLVDPIGTDREWLQFSHARLYMQIAGEANEIAERFMFRQIDGKGHTIGEFAGELTGMLKRYHAAGALYGATFEEAAVVDTSANTAATAAARELHATLAVRMAGMAEVVRIPIAKVPVTEPVAA